MAMHLSVHVYTHGRTNGFWQQAVLNLATDRFIFGNRPFANIAHGCNSIIATRAALKLSDYVVTEAGIAICCYG